MAVNGPATKKGKDPSRFRLGNSLRATTRLKCWEEGRVLSQGCVRSAGSIIKVLLGCEGEIYVGCYLINDGFNLDI